MGGGALSSGSLLSAMDSLLRHGKAILGDPTRLTMTHLEPDS